MHRENRDASTSTPPRRAPMAARQQSVQRKSIRWQLVASSIFSQSQAGDPTNQLTRIDLAHPLFPPHLPLCWKREVGSHQQLFTAAVEAAQDTSFVDNKRAAAIGQIADYQEPAQTQAWHAGRTMPTRPKMLETRHGTSRIRNTSTHNTDVNASKNVSDWTSIVSLAGPLAYDLQKPLAAADQALQSIAGKIQSGNPMSMEDSRLLSSTAHSLTVLSRWTDNVLLSHKSMHGEFSMVRRRFRVLDWRNSLQDLLESTANRRDVHLEWVGWDESLPNLYLDPNLISKALYNLSDFLIQASPTGSTLRLRAVRHPAASRRLIIAVEADNHALPADIIQLINGSVVTVSPSMQNIALTTAKKLIVAHGGMLTAHRNLHGGCDLRITLPIDSAESLISSWLLANSQLGTLSSKSRVDLFAAKLQSGNAELANTYLQQAADSSSLVIRVSKSRWFIFELNPIEQRSCSRTIQAAINAQMDASAPEIESEDYANGFVSNRQVNSSRFHWLEQVICRTRTGTDVPMQCGSTSDQRLPHLILELAGKTQVLLDKQPLLLDGFLSARRPVVLPNPLEETKASARYNPIEAPLRNQRIDQLSVRRSLTSTEAPGAQVVSEIIRQWKIVQAKLAQLNDGLAVSRAG